MNSDYHDFTTYEVASEFRPIPFWSWNAELEETELIRQIHEMYHAGMGGFIMHARGGLKTKYLGKKWLDCINLCTREALKLGMLPYLYDENGWPSGFGDGKVNALGEKYQQKYLNILERLDSSMPLPEHIIAAFDQNFQQTAPEQARFIVHYSLNPYYVDNLDAEVTGKFIEFVYEYYYQTLPEDVRDGISGIFTDEPQISRKTAPWSLIIEKEYQSAYQEELLPRIIELFYETGNWKRTRVRYYRLCTQLFRKNYIEQIGNWCKAHGWKLTGHHFGEESFSSQLYSNGAIMPQYCGYDIPGNDHLGRVESYITVDTQLVSAAAQLGKKQILTETFGCSGWNFNMRGMEWLYQQQMVHGINYLCQHLEGYSLRGLRKRDYPMSVFYQHPMWKHIRQQNDTFSRVGSILASGKIQCDTVIFHGESSAHIAADGVRCFTDLAKKCWSSMLVLSEKLEVSGVPFHYADEVLTEELGKVDSGKLKIGQMAYKVFLLPEVLNISGKIVALLKEFHAQGGKIFCSVHNDFEKISIDGEPASEETAEFFKTLPQFDEFGTLPEFAPEDIRKIDCRVLEGTPGQIRGTWRVFPGKNETWYFIADFAAIPENAFECDWKITPLHWDTLGNESPVKCEITLPYAADEILCIDQASGKILSRIQHLNVNGKARFFHTFSARGSVLLKAVTYPKIEPKDLTGNWKVVSGKNVLLLDTADYRREDDQQLVENCNTLTIFERMLALPDSRIELFFHFTCAPGFNFSKAALAMALERDPEAEYYLNGNKLPDDFSGYFIDRGIEVLKLPESLLREGENEFKINLPFHQSPEIRAHLERAKHFESESNKLYYDSEIEAIYLLGDFQCRAGKITPDQLRTAFADGPFILENSTDTISLGNLLDAGYLFFSGDLNVTQDFELTTEQAALFRTLKFSPCKANSLSVNLNGTTLPLIYTAPYELDISGLLRPGKNTLSLELSTSCRNTLGPMHMTEINPYAVGPSSFLLEPNFIGAKAPNHTDAYGIIDYGLEITLE